MVTVYVLTDKHWAKYWRIPWTARRSNQSILKDISPWCSLEGLMLKLKLQYFGHLMWRADSLENSDAGKDWRWEEKGMREDEMVGWHHGLNGHGFGWTPGVGDGQGGLACCSSWVAKSQTRLSNWSIVEVIGKATKAAQRLLLRLGWHQYTCLDVALGHHGWFSWDPAYLS